MTDYSPSKQSASSQLPFVAIKKKSCATEILTDKFVDENFATSKLVGLKNTLRFRKSLGKK